MAMRSSDMGNFEVDPPLSVSSDEAVCDDRKVHNSCSH
jgi:hypothetical protein